MNFALALAKRLPNGLGQAPAHELLGRDVSDATSATIAKAENRSQAVALALGSPEFQRH
jgi:uncharacterized protein (DUF1800 family)